MVFGIGIVWFSLQFGSMQWGDAAIALDRATLLYGLVAAVFVTVSNILLIECMGHLPISMASTIYRLNTVPLVILAFFFLGESIDLLRGAGIAFGLITVLLLYKPNDGRVESTQRYSVFVGLIILASLIRALYGATTKAGVNLGGDPDTMMLFAAIGWIVGGIAYAHWRGRSVFITKAKLKFIVVAGLLVFSVVWLLTTALTLGDASVVVPLANMGFVAAFALSLLLGLESLDVKKFAAIVCAVFAILMLSVSS